MGVVLESSLVGEVTPPGLRGEGEDRVRANNLRRMRMVMLIVLIVKLMMVVTLTL